MKILICGHKSFAAKGIADLLIGKGHEVHCFSRGEEGRLENEISGDVFNMASNKFLSTRYDVVINYIIIKDSSIEENLRFINSLHNYCNSHTGRLIQISSISVYPDVPIVNEDSQIEKDLEKKGSYAAVKIAVDQFLIDKEKEYNISFVRPGFIVENGKSFSKVGICIDLPLGLSVLLGNKRMGTTFRIIHCITSIDEITGGPARSTTSLVNALCSGNDIEAIELLSLKSENPLYDYLHNKKISVLFFEPALLDYSKDLDQYLLKSTSSLFHGHGIWNLPIHQMAKVARKKSIPYVLSIRGMLEPWSMQQSVMKKKLAMALYQHKDLQNATCLHATALSEAESIRNLGYRNPIAVIPNGIDISNYPMIEKEMTKFGKKKMLFLSRVHHKKGIEILIEAWSLLEASLKHNWEVEIAGNGEKEYITSLQTKIQIAGLENEIKITGAHFGEEKIKTYHSADVFVLPTYSENFGMVVAEALSCGIPVITTKGTPWKDLEDYNAGSWIDIGVEPLKKTLEVYLQKDNSELERMGRNGRKLVEEKYSIESVGEKFKKLYEWMLNKGEKPEFVL